MYSSLFHFLLFRAIQSVKRRHPFFSVLSKYPKTNFLTTILSPLDDSQLYFFFWAFWGDVELELAKSMEE
jgi:hypothetical protein